MPHQVYGFAAVQRVQGGASVGLHSWV
uniref:Uncharacterized protein n=1 Tax=Arundo donax TaxID=35708 RepID=A0A0A8Z996_ARUDO